VQLAVEGLAVEAVTAEFAEVDGSIPPLPM
jgi:hypothetical protein